MKKKLWVIKFRAGHDLVPEPRFWPDFEAEGIEVIVADQFFAVVEADYQHLEKILRDYVYLKNTGHPADGRWVGIRGIETYIVNGEVIDDVWEAWELLGLKPKDFDGNSWDEVDADVVRAAIPCY